MVYDGKSIKWIQMDDGLQALVLHIAQREVQIATERHLGVEKGSHGDWTNQKMWKKSDPIEMAATEV
jgi:hypothetical protein